MKNFKARFVVFIAALFSCTAVFAQSNTLLTTTLTAAVTSPSQTVFTLAAVTGLVSGPSGISSLYVDGETAQVRLVNSTTLTATVIRGADGTKATLHASGAAVYLIPYNNFLSKTDRQGSCTYTNELVLPVINEVTGNIYTCPQTPTGGSAQWILIAEGTMHGPTSQKITAFCTGVVITGASNILGGGACATTAGVAQVVSSPGVLYGLEAQSSAVVVGGTGKDVVTVFKNGSATAITCTIAASAQTCSDLVDSVNAVIGDVITVKIVSATSDTAANVSATLEKH